MTILRPHDLRARVLAEVHARPFAPIATPSRLLHFGFMTDAAAAAADRRALACYCGSLGLPEPAPDAKQHRVTLSDARLRWESHSEFTTYTWELVETGEARPFAATLDRDAFMARLPQPGPLLVAIDLHILAERDGTAFDEVFNVVPAASAVDGGDAVAATDFYPDTGGFVRILVLDRGLGPTRAGALAQRLVEIETYRTLALLGLPEAQRLGPVIGRIETELPQVMAGMQTSAGLEDNHRLLDRLTALAVELEGNAAASLFRFGATRAYDRLIRMRLAVIGERPLSGHGSWSDFLSRRFEPAIRTCAAAEERQANLSRKLARAAQLLRTRVDVELEQQNRDLLSAMNDRTKLQLRLQQTVEGLSVAAITYYVSSLAHLVFEGLHTAGLHLDPTVATACVVPFAFAAVWAVVRSIRRRHADGH